MPEFHLPTGYGANEAQMPGPNHGLHQNGPMPEPSRHGPLDHLFKTFEAAATRAAHRSIHQMLARMNPADGQSMYPPGPQPGAPAAHSAAQAPTGSTDSALMPVVNELRAKVEQLEHGIRDILAQLQAQPSTQSRVAPVVPPPHATGHSYYAPEMPRRTQDDLGPGRAPDERITEWRSSVSVTSEDTARYSEDELRDDDGFRDDDGLRDRDEAPTRRTSAPRRPLGSEFPDRQAGPARPADEPGAEAQTQARAMMDARRAQRDLVDKARRSVFHTLR